MKSMVHYCPFAYIAFANVTNIKERPLILLYFALRIFAMIYVKFNNFIRWFKLLISVGIRLSKMIENSLFFLVF